MSIWMYVKLVLGAAVLFEAYHLGGDAATAKYATAELALAKAAAAALTSRDNQIITTENAYDAIKDIPDPATVGLATRLRLVTVQADCPVPGGSALAQGADPARSEPRRDASVERATQAVFDACEADAKQLNAVIQLAPQGTHP